MKLLVSMLSCTMLMLAVGCTDKSDRSTEDAVNVSPERIYARRCASCHGPEGKGDGPMSPTFANVSDLSDERVQSRHSDEDLKVIITKGYKRMPPVRNLSNPQLEALITQVRILGGAEPEAAPAPEEETPAKDAKSDDAQAD